MKNYDVIGIGGPTHYRGTSKLMKSFLKKMENLKLGNKQGFAFETKGGFRLAGSAAKKITKFLRKTGLQIIHYPITCIVNEKEIALQEKSLERIELIAINLSEGINDSTKYQDTRHKNRIRIFLNRVKWFLIGGGPIFFFIRALYLAITRRDCFSTINPGCSWFLLILEILISGTAGISGILGLLSLRRVKIGIVVMGKYSLKKFILLIGISSYLIHFVRVGIWLTFCVL